MTTALVVPAAPALAGLCTHAQAAVGGPGVDITVTRLRRYVYVKSQSMLFMASRFNGLPEWEVKGALALHLWQDAEHSTWLRQRVTEMRTPPHHLDKAPDEALAAFVGQWATARDTLEFLVAVYDVLKPACVAAFAQHLAQANPIADYPTRRLLQFVIQEDQAQIDWGRQAIAAVCAREGREPAESALESWRDHLRGFLAAAEGIHGDTPGNPVGAPLPRALSQPVSQSPVRDSRFTRVWRSRGVVPTPERPVHERLWWMMNVRLQEMHVAELVASVIAEWQGQPWAFYHELARHLWDETRHCLLGEVAFATQGIDFAALPTHVGFAEYPNTQLTPPDRYAFLWGIEQGLMTKSGKQAEVALAKAGGDELATVFQDFDWADEVLHAQIGRRWLEAHYGSREAMNAAYERVRPAYDEMKDEDLKQPGRDWWPQFYETYLNGKDPHPGQQANAEGPPAASY